MKNRKKITSFQGTTSPKFLIKEKTKNWIPIIKYVIIKNDDINFRYDLLPRKSLLIKKNFRSQKTFLVLLFLWFDFVNKIK